MSGEANLGGSRGVVKSLGRDPLGRAIGRGGNRESMIQARYRSRVKYIQ